MSDPISPVPRLPLHPPEIAGAATQEHYARIRREARGVNHLIQQLGPVPAAVELAYALSQVAKQLEHIPPRIAEAARLRVAVAVRCHYCTGWHTRFAALQGYSPAELEAIRDLEQCYPAALDADTALAVAVAHEMSLHALTEDTFGRARLRWGTQGVLELIALVAAQNATSRIGAALNPPFEPGYLKLLEREQARQAEAAR